MSKLQPAQESGQAIITNTPLSQICKGNSILPNIEPTSETQDYYKITTKLHYIKSQFHKLVKLPLAVARIPSISTLSNVQFLDPNFPSSAPQS